MLDEYDDYPSIKTLGYLGMESNSLVQEIIDFWFGAPDSSDLGKHRETWFQATSEFDEKIRQRFSDANRLASNGALDDLKKTQMGTLALIILLDQFSRNIFRGMSEAFANDSKARSLAEYALKERFDRNVLTVQRLFFYLPFEHAEDLELQEKSVALFVNLGDASSLSHALCHRDQIVRFGRFPDRNNALGRRSTKAEEKFLQNPFC
jgi:uncharacterized protein (DUF924 family)